MERRKLEYGVHSSKKQPPPLLDNEHRAIADDCESREGHPPNQPSDKLGNLSRMITVRSLSRTAFFSRYTKRFRKYRVVPILMIKQSLYFSPEWYCSWYYCCTW